MTRKNQACSAKVKGYGEYERSREDCCLGYGNLNEGVRAGDKIATVTESFTVRRARSNMQPRTLPASAFTSAYVLDKVRDEDAWSSVSAGLQDGLPSVETEFAVMVMIDISGYSNFTSALAKAGKVSSEVISSTVARYLDGLIRILHGFRGDVIKFLGDAVLVSFSPSRFSQQHDASAKREVARRAILCCATILTELPRVAVDLSACVNIGEIAELAVNAAMARDEGVYHAPPYQSKGQSIARRDESEFPSGEGPSLSLRLHVAVTCGMVDRCIIGSQNARLDYVVYGDCMKDLSYILDGTGKDQLGISNLTWKLLDYAETNMPSISNCGFVVLTGDNFSSVIALGDFNCTAVLPNLIEPELTDEQHCRLLKFLPTALAHRIMETRREFFLRAVAESNEFRCVTAVFVKLKWGSNVKRAQRCMRAFLECIGEHHGVFQQFAVDDKGQTMRLEDDFNVSISLATGEILMSVFGNELRAEATGLGDSINMAARLLSVDKVKGKKEAAGIWSLSDGEFNATSLKYLRKPVDQYGYSKEREILTTAVQDWLRGDSQLLAVVEGPSGVGKSSFMNGAIRMLEPYGVTISLCQGSTVDQGTPYFAIRGLLERIITEMAEPGMSTRRNTVRNSTTRSQTSFQSAVASEGRAIDFTEKLQLAMLASGVAQEMVPLMRSIFPVALGDSLVTNTLTAEKRANILQSIVLQVIRKYTMTTSTPTAILLDDVQECPKIGILIITRSMTDYVVESLKLMMENPFVQHIQLNGLEKLDASALIVSCLQVPEILAVNDTLLDSLFNLLGGSGSPLLISTIVSSQRQTILENSELRDGVLCLADGATLNLKLDIASGIQTQFDSLGHQSKAFFRYAASLGQYFDLAMIVRVFGLELHLEDIELWIESQDPFLFLSFTVSETGKRSYFFRHISILNCIYEGISFTDRKAIHLSVATYLEGEMRKLDSGVDDEFFLPLVAYHYGRTGEFAKIVDLLYSRKYMVLECIRSMEFLLSAVRARQSDAAILKRIGVLEDMPSEITLIRWKRLLADHYRFNGDHEKSVPLFKDILKSLGISFPEGLRACRRECKRQIVKQLWLYQRTAGATRDLKTNVPLDSERTALVMGILSVFIIVLMTDPESLLGPDLIYQRTLTALLMANQTMATAGSQPVAAAHSLGYVACMLVQLSVPLARLFLGRYERFRARLRPDQRAALAGSGITVAMGLYLWGEVARGRDHLSAAAAVGRVNPQMLWNIVGNMLPTDFMLSRGGSINDEIEGAVEGLAASVDFRKSNHHFLLAMGSCAVANHYWFAGEDEEATAWTTMTSSHGEKTGNRYHRAIYKMPVFLRALFTTDYFEACNIYLHLAKELNPPLPWFPQFGTLLPHLILMSLILLFPAPFTRSKSFTVTSDRQKQILQGLSLLASANKYMLPVMHSVLSLWAHYVAKAILTRFSGRKFGDPGRSKLKRMLDGKEGQKVEDWAVLRGYTCATIALCALDTVERQRYMEAARVEFSKTFIRLQTWWRAQMSE
ncbi:hypothetical protein HK101_001444 [Irineochytrium annulatum]|nr:hypothetical protein HK101_001444 [Irineochytrium annulatum]